MAPVCMELTVMPSSWPSGIFLWDRWKRCGLLSFVYLDGRLLKMLMCFREEPIWVAADAVGEREGKIQKSDPWRGQEKGTQNVGE